MSNWSRWEWAGFAGVLLIGVAAFGTLAWLMWPARRPVVAPERTIVDDFRDLAAVPDDHPFYEDEPDDDGNGWGEDDYPHDQAATPPAVEVAPERTWMDTVRATPLPPIATPVEVEPSAALTTATSGLRILTGYGHDAAHEGEVVDDSGWRASTPYPAGWYPPVSRVAAPPLPMETTETPLIGLDMHKQFGYPVDRYDGPTGPSGGFTGEWTKDLLAEALAEGERLRLIALETGVDPQLSGWTS